MVLAGCANQICGRSALLCGFWCLLKMLAVGISLVGPLNNQACCADVSGCGVSSKILLSCCFSLVDSASLLITGDDPSASDGLL